MPRAPLASDLPCVSRCLAWPCALLSFVFSPLAPLFAPCFLFLVLSPHHSLLSLQPKGSGHRLCLQSWSLAPYWHKLLQAQLYWGPLEQGGERIADATHNSGHSSVFVLGSRHGFRVMPRHHCLSPRPCAPRCHAGKAQLGGFGAVAGLYWEQSLIAGSSGHAPSQIHPQRCDVIACLTLAISSAECGLEVTSKGFQGRLENMTWCLGGSVRQLRLGRFQAFLIHKMWLIVGTTFPTCRTKLGSPHRIPCWELPTSARQELRSQRGLAVLGTSGLSSLSCYGDLVPTAGPGTLRGAPHAAALVYC
ncbi:hypothetical protein KIL84_001032 [Mauremys mutica]|uniref:Uncharacterized protein n=1 Tax=Mauremys mutica TaxID=74926 RepID=A0A9D3WXS6_9SAUR|nr:hypothetical protein KIL84_001032 [Mauremys mutica]